MAIPMMEEKNIWPVRTAQVGGAPRRWVMSPDNPPRERWSWQTIILRAALALTLIIAFLAAGTAVARRGTTSPVDRALDMANIPATVTLTVQPGDTLWSLAGKYGDPKKGITDRVDALVNENGFRPGASLHPGQRLLVRVENPIEVARLRLRQARGTAE